MWHDSTSPSPSPLCLASSSSSTSTSLQCSSHRHGALRLPRLPRKPRKSYYDQEELLYCDTDEEVQGHGEQEDSPPLAPLCADAETVIWRDRKFGMTSAGIRAGWARRKRRGVEKEDDDEYRQQGSPRGV
ncbi:hypothetical protein BCV69DRAFT_279709 [Microstroma glucosiphilum]|uniref:Uncharacterized protein n=1 Tax=Pseudomicrostroma glucosiphilum TaxID=1684307 RepID=A0A316UIM2_9BASI|nr:hypothetical protein BCV69DRAFT_279709 [Pseudomicrostroma glucosiphilum]PWN23793.1 hypothetical protein BCV69DRAFT_279709 [Pseudomicrostroma glucosiphilum]